MAKYFNEQEWAEAIRDPDWYLKLQENYKHLMELADKSDKEESDAIKEEIYGFFELHLAENNIALGSTGPDWDKERKPVDIIVIHHSKNPPGITWQRLSAMHLIRLYASYYASPYYENEKYIKGQPIYSGHFRNGQQVFYAYHWLLRMNGKIERLLSDNETGWHAGNWEINCRSVAICLDNDFENSSPSKPALSSIAKLIKENYPQVEAKNILGHKEINPKTICPGNKFLDGWKLDLIDIIKDLRGP